MKRPGYRAKRGLLGMSEKDRRTAIDSLLDADILSAAERRALLMDPELLAGAVEFFVQSSVTVEDANGVLYLPVKGGKRVYDLDGFMEFLSRDGGRLQRLAEVVSEALFVRLAKDAVAAQRS
jgi:hypothetical protein